MPDDHPQTHQRDAAWKLAYLKRHAIPNATVGTIVFALSLLLSVPAWQFLAASVLIGLISYACWSCADRPEFVLWLIMLGFMPCLWVAVAYSASVSTAVGAVQLVSLVLLVMSLGFLFERRA